MNKPKITQTTKEGDDIVHYKSSRIATDVGNSSHVVLPKALSGKMIEVEYRSKEFIQSLGKGKSIYECEDENDMIDELEEEQ